MSRIVSDLRFALRNLGRSKLFLVVTITSLALGIGANTAIFTLVDQLLLRLLPVRDPKQLVMIWTTGPHMGSNRGIHMAYYPMYQDFQQKAQAFSYVFCRRETPLSVSIGGRSGWMGKWSREISFRRLECGRRSDVFSRPSRTTESIRGIRP